MKNALNFFVIALPFSILAQVSYEYRAPYLVTDTLEVVISYIDSGYLIHEARATAICSGTAVPAIKDGQWQTFKHYDFCEYEDHSRGWLHPEAVIIETKPLDIEASSTDGS